MLILLYIMKRKLLFTLSVVFLTGISVYANLYVNEVNSTGKWIEIYNSGENTVAVGGYTVTRYNNDGAVASATLPAGTALAPKGFLVLYQGSVVAPPVAGAVDCLPFGISSDKFISVVLKTNQGDVVDNFDIGDPQTVKVSSGKSWARETDGDETIVALEPTPGKPNSSPPAYSDLAIFINEVNSTGKWIEIYNDEANAVNMGGYTVTRYNNDGAAGIASIPAGVYVASKGFLVIYEGPASGGTSPSPVEGAYDCMPYGISSEKFMRATLRDNQGKIIDESFDIGNPQTVLVSSGKSWAREADGKEIIAALEPSPGKPNDAPPSYSQLKIYINEVNSTGKWIEIYNDEPNAVDVGEYTVTRYNNDGAVGIASLPLGTAIASKRFLVIYQGSAAVAPVAGALDCMDYGISSDKFMRATLRDNQGNIVDETFNIGDPQQVKVSDGESWAREPDGSPDIKAQNPSPGSKNAVPYSISKNFPTENPLVFVFAGMLSVPENTSSIQLYSVSGSLVLNRKITAASLNLTDLPKGFYIVKLTISDKVFTQKIVL